MDGIYLNALRESLIAYNVVFEDGLSIREIEHIEYKYNFRMPPDLRLFLQFALPVSEGWVNWRHTSEDDIRFMLNRPLDGMCFDIETNGFWMEEWGDKPLTMQECFQIAKNAVRAAPKLIPIYGRCYIPDEPASAGNPILWISQTTIRYDGYDLADFFQENFRNEYYLDSPITLPELPKPPWMAQSPKQVRFWDEVKERNKLCWVLHQDIVQEQ